MNLHIDFYLTNMFFCCGGQKLYLKDKNLVSWYVCWYYWVGVMNILIEGGFKNPVL